MGYALADPGALPPLPIIPDVLVDDCFRWAEAQIIGNMVESRSVIALEVWDDPAGAPHDGLSRFVLVALRPPTGDLFDMLTPDLRREMRCPWRFRPVTLDCTLGQLFARMAKKEQSTWFMPFHRSGGSAMFVCRDARDPELCRIRHFNRKSSRPRGVQGIVMFSRGKPV